MATETRTEWEYTPPERYGEKGVYTPHVVEVEVPDKEPYNSGAADAWCWVIAIIVFALTVWITTEWMSDGMSGKCQTELGYMGQSEVVECEP